MKNMTGLRWWVIALVALATVINYIDRQSLNVLWPAIAADLYPDKTADEHKQIYAFISVVFVFSYAFGQAIFGKIFDKIGTRLGFAVSITVWSIATALHSLAKGVASFALFRAVLGVAEAGNWPGAAKANAEWFPSKERAFAQGIFNSGAAIGGIIAIPLIAFLSVYFGWKAIFILIGLAGLLWLVPWLYIVKAPPERHPWMSAEERDYIINNRSGTPEPVFSETEYDPSTAELLSHKQSWGVILASAAIDPIWWLFVFWIPIYLSEVFGMDVKQIGIYGWVPYVGAMFGAWFGGGLAQWLMTKGWSLNATRKSVISLGCLIMLPSFLLMSDPGTPFNAVMIMAVILFGFQTAIGSVQTLPSDLFGGKPVGTLAGIAGMSAKLGAAALTSLVPWLTAGGNYTPAFVIGAALAITAMMSILVLCPKVERLEVSR
jgi:ACS family hexuronate transporter-like MFS transporter